MSAVQAVTAALLSVFGLDTPRPAPVVPGPPLESPPLLLWQRALPGTPPSTATRAEPAAPVVDATHIFVGFSGTNALLVLDRRDGGLVTQLPMHAPVASAPVLDGGFLYVSDTAGYTAAFRLDHLRDATPVWEHFSGAPILSSPTLEDGRLYLSNVDDLVYALNATNGELEWRYAHRMSGVRTAELELFGAPAPVIEDGTVYVGFSDGFLVALGQDDGSPRWNVEIGEGAYPDLIAPALPLGRSVIVGGYTEPLCSVDTATRSVSWRLPFGSSAPWRLDGETLWHGGPDGVLRRIDARTGNLVWEWDSGTGGSIGTPTPTPAGLLVTSSEGSLYLVNPENGSLRWTFDPGVLMTGIAAPPAVDGDLVYVLSNSGVLYALRGGEGRESSPSPDWVAPG